MKCQAVVDFLVNDFDDHESLYEIQLLNTSSNILGYIEKVDMNSNPKAREL